MRTQAVDQAIQSEESCLSMGIRPVKIRCHGSPEPSAGVLNRGGVIPGIGGPGSATDPGHRFESGSGIQISPMTGRNWLVSLEIDHETGHITNKTTTDTRFPLRCNTGQIWASDEGGEYDKEKGTTGIAGRGSGPATGQAGLCNQGQTPQPICRPSGIRRSKPSALYRDSSQRSRLPIHVVGEGKSLLFGLHKGDVGREGRAGSVPMIVDGLVRVSLETTRLERVA